MNKAWVVEWFEDGYWYPVRIEQTRKAARDWSNRDLNYFAKHRIRRWVREGEK
jgi:hypothetical protein